MVANLKIKAVNYIVQALYIQGWQLPPPDPPPYAHAYSQRPLRGLCSFVLGLCAASVVSVITVLGAVRLDSSTNGMGFITQ